MKKLRIAILVDNPRSWYVRYAKRLCKKMQRLGHKASYLNDAKNLPKGDIAFFLSCEKLIGKSLRERNTHNVVIHPSAVPQGKGWSPLAWSVLEGKKIITVSLFEAEDKVDSGNVYLRKKFPLDGTELADELRRKEAKVIEELALEFVRTYPPGKGEVQRGKESFYKRRTPEDSELDIQKPLVKQFNLLRIVDNKRYPAFFKHNGATYILKIYKKKR